MTTTLSPETRRRSVFAGRSNYSDSVKNIFVESFNADYSLPLSSIYNILPQDKYLNAVNTLIQQVEMEPNRVRHINLEDLVNSFHNLVLALLGTNPEGIHVQMTTVNSLVLKANTSKGNVYAEVFFDEETGWTQEAVLNIFKNKELQLSDYGSVDEIVSSLKAYFRTDAINYIAYLNPVSEYAISGSNFTTY